MKDQILPSEINVNVDIDCSDRTLVLVLPLECSCAWILATSTHHWQSVEVPDGSELQPVQFEEIPEDLRVFTDINFGEFVNCWKSMPKVLKT